MIFVILMYMIDIKYLKKSFNLVFSSKIYIVLAILVALLFLLLAIIIPSFSVIKFFWNNNILHINIFKLLINYFIGNTTFYARFLTMVISILSGINIAMLVFYLRRRVKLEKNAGTGIVGIIFGLLGVGCASCGSIIFSSFFGLAATSSFLGILPFQGKEFGVIGIVLLLWSIYSIAKKVQNPLLCKL